jgi:8-oxo-dGTP diphosphatase
MKTGIHPNGKSPNIHTDRYIPQLSVDCVVFGFHGHQLKVLLLKSPFKNEWAIPGGYIQQIESVEEAANRVLKERTGLDGVFLQQFKVFSEPNRNKKRFPRNFLQEIGFSKTDIAWLDQRFITIGFYALVDFTRALPTPDQFSELSEWWVIENVQNLMLDHQTILNAALEAMQLQLNYQPIGYNLLPDKFTIPELQRLYETILGKKLDRRNFERKIRSYHILTNLNERKSGCAHKSPALYRFNLENYQKALREGLKGGW